MWQVPIIPALMLLLVSYPSPFYFSYFSDKVSLFAHSQPWATTLLTYPSCLAGISVANHHAQFIC
jgi:hypothetical protein